MNHVLCIFESYEPTNAELYNLLQACVRHEYFELRSKRCLQVKAEDIKWCDVIISVRSTSVYETLLAKYTKKIGKYWILMLDDDFLSLDQSYGRFGQGYRLSRKKYLISTLKSTDCLLAVNEHLARKYVEIGKIPKCAFVNTIIKKEELQKPLPSIDKVKIVYYVNDGTKSIYKEWIYPLIPYLAKNYQGKVEIYFMSVKPNDLGEYESRIAIHYIPHMPFEKFKNYMCEQHFDIGLAPLNDDGFSKYKYFNKYIEYTRAGIAGVYSDCTLYRKVIKDGRNGVLCQNDSSSWIKAISELIEYPSKRISIVKTAQAYAENEFSEETITDKLIRDIPELMHYNSPKTAISKAHIAYIVLRYKAFRVTGWINTFLSCIRNRNIKGLLSQVKAVVKGEK